MKQKLITCLVLLTQTYFSHSQQSHWKIAGDRLSTRWSQQVDPSNVLPEYPRPQMTRSNNWINLNGLWDCTILPKTDQQDLPATYSGNILVPFAIESGLSGVAKTVGKDSVLWYRKTINIPATFKNKNTLLHFGAVDWLCDVYVNGKQIGTHQGGFDPFTFNITAALKKGTQQQVTVRVWDPSDDGPQPRGKQIRIPNGIWYTPVTGIWQTVWLEAVPATYIVSTKQTPDLDQQRLTISAQLQNAQPSDKISVIVFDGEQQVAAQATGTTEAVTLSIKNAKIWSQENPFLYDIRVSVERNGKVIDEVKSYAAMRKISLAPDANGVQRLMLNNKFVFQYGPLDQGWWPDGLYTAPTDEAMKFDIVKTKEMGFNMIRKHVKVEPARWYYYCDKMGMLVWQDMPSGDLGNRWDSRPFIEGRGTEKIRTPASEKIYRMEWNAIIDALYNFPSIVVWTPFNEAWGQFKTEEIVDWTSKKDSSRLINTASGGNFFRVGDIIDLHNYPEPAMPDGSLFGSKQALVLGEFGGLGLPLQGHTWQDKNWGYQSFGTSDSLLLRYAGFMNAIPDMIKKGLSAAVYTQTTDVEGEVNGLMTYDRKIIKMPVDKLQQLHIKFHDPALVQMK